MAFIPTIPPNNKTHFNGLPEDVQPYPTSNVSPYGIGSSSQPYQSFFTPDPNSVGSLSNVYDVLHPPYPYSSASDSANWLGLASDPNSEPSMHNEHGFNVTKAIPEWRYPIEQSQMYPLKIPDIIIPPSGINPLAETDNSKQLQAGIEIELEHTNNRSLAKQIALDHLKEDSQYYTKLLTRVEPQKKYLLEKIAEAKKNDQKKDLRNLLLKWVLLLGGIVGINAILKSYEDTGVERPLEVFAEYQYHGHVSDDDCAPYNGKRFNLLETHNRPVIPSENLGYTTTHPNCKCTWKVVPNYKGVGNSLSRKEESDIHGIENHINQAAKDGTLHTVKKDGELGKKTTKKNPLKELCNCMTVTLPSIKLDLPKTRLSNKVLQESIANLRSEFDWLTEEYVSKARELAYDSGGQLYLVRAAGETITDHTSEGEPYRRKLSAEELNSMTRTAIGKSMDINHQPELEVDATILDAEFDKRRKEIQMLVIVKDPQINNAIEDRKITAVSINGGMPRSETVEPCDHDCTSNDCELCLVPKGVVLGELDGIGMTFVVTDPNGMYLNGRFVPSAQPGIKFTRIETL